MHSEYYYAQWDLNKYFFMLHSEIWTSILFQYPTPRRITESNKYFVSVPHPQKNYRI